ncbi:hypothetical protein [Haloglomus halophilum]|uniref:hypothetical protein n=1 Tax=Haloglomus halophilum TaxID=2962672 RepID=UPI0020C9F3EF|nr:hypothetical protein [Haloglomus halophilum]
MSDCDYCEESFGSEKAYHKHLKAEHEGELGPIDRRRVGLEGNDESTLSDAAGPIALGAIVVFAAAIIGYLVFFAGSGGATTPHNLGAVHGHGTINVTVLGQSPDFSTDQYQLRDDYWHFEGGNGRIWHVHGEGVTLKYAMDTVGIGVTDDSITFQGTTYEDSDPEYNVEVTVGGEDVDPSSYVLRGESQSPSRAQTSTGSHIRVVVTRAT